MIGIVSDFRFCGHKEERTEKRWENENAKRESQFRNSDFIDDIIDAPDPSVNLSE